VNTLWCSINSNYLMNSLPKSSGSTATGKSNSTELLR
jgi:hypothetical protein